MLFRRGEKVVLEIDRKTPLPVEMDRFWPSSRNKANLETLIDRTALSHTWNQSVKQVLVSSFAISGRTGLLFYKRSGRSVTEVFELNADIEEADLRTVLYALHATKMHQ